jgi:UDPglucose 6-dehydrogenase
VYDPMAMDNAKAVHPHLGYAEDAMTAATGADVLVIVTPWPEFGDLDPEAVGSVVANRAVIDARHAIDADEWESASWKVRFLGGA